MIFCILVTRFGIITLIIFCNELIFCQSHWQKINSEQFQKCEDIAISKAGKIYVALRYKNIIVESKDQGNSWLNIVNDTFTDHLSVELDTQINAKEAILNIYTLSGIAVQRYSLASNKNKIKLESNLNPGYYLYNIRLPDGKLLSGKLVKI